MIALRGWCPNPPVCDRLPLPRRIGCAAHGGRPALELTAQVTDDVLVRVLGGGGGKWKRSKIRDMPEAAGRRRGVRASTSRGNKGCVDLDALLAGHCRQAVTLLPRGVLGVATAIEFLGALPGACRLGLPDVTDSGPKLFALLVAHGVLAAMPSPRVVPAALALVAGVSPLLQARSARQWTLWLGQVREPSSAFTTRVARADADEPDQPRTADHNSAAAPG
jgi:hypothetical protein